MTTVAMKPKRTRTVFNMPQRLTTDGTVGIVCDGDYIRIAATDADGDTESVTVSEYGALCLLRKLAEQLKVTIPPAVVDKIKQTEPREPRELKGA
jgi:phosphomannomutase